MSNVGVPTCMNLSEQAEYVMELLDFPLGGWLQCWTNCILLDMSGLVNVFGQSLIIFDF